MNRDKWIRITFSLFLLILLVQCTSGPPVQERIAPLKPVNSIAVLPFEPMAGLTKEQAAMIEPSLEPLNNLLAQYLAEAPMVRFIADPERDSYAAEAYADSRTRAQAIGKATGNDAVLTPFVRRYYERIGNEYSASRPASVNLEFELIASDTGEILWSGEYDETQEPLLRNLLNFSRSAQRGFKWVTAEQLAREGMNGKLDDCPYIQLLRKPKSDVGS